MKISFSLRNKRVWVAGHRGMVGAALVRCLQNHDEGCEILTASRAELDLRHQGDVEGWVSRQRPDVVVLAAARVGGIDANRKYPADFIYDNLMIEANVIHAAYRSGVEKLLFLGSSCIYPREAEQPIGESALLTGALEPTNESYAIAKIAGIKLCQSYRAQYGCDFIAAMPCNLYGPGDTYDLSMSHVIPALLMKFHEAKMNRMPFVTLWGTGNPLREFLYVEDLADALLTLLTGYSGSMPVNIGSGEEISIAALAQIMANVTGYEGEIRFDPAHPDGTPRKLLNSDFMRMLGWRPRTRLEEGVKTAYADYLRREGNRAAA